MSVVRLLKGCAVGVAVVLLVGVAGVSSASALSGWWHLSSGSRPANIRPGVARNEVQKLTVSITHGGFTLAEPVAFSEGRYENSKGEPLYVELPYNATAGQVEEGLESFYGAGTVEVSELGAGSREFSITFKGALADQPLLPVATEEATVTEVAAGQADGEISVNVENLGDAPVDGSVTPVQIVDKLPKGLRAVGIVGTIPSGNTSQVIPCSLGSLSCTLTGTLAPYKVIEVRVLVVVEPGASSGEANEVSVSGGGAPAASLARPVVLSDVATPFGVEDYELTPEEEGGVFDTRAGSHPFQLTGALALNQGPDTASLHERDLTPLVVPVGLTKDLSFRLPPGLVGNTLVIPRCTMTQFLTESSLEAADECPSRTAVGVATVTVYEPTLGYFTDTLPLFNLETGVGEPARFGIYVSVSRTPVVLDTSVRTGSDYGVTVSVTNTTQDGALIASVVTFWGVPGDPKHDGSRGWGCLAKLSTAISCPAVGETSPPPLLSLPASCTGELQSSLEADSWEEPHNVLSFGLSRPMPAMDGCNQLQFAPSIGVTPDVQSGSTPSGLAVHVHVPQEAGEGAAGLVPSGIKDASVTLPEGMVLNPSGASGLEACSETQVGFQGLDGTGVPLFTSGLPEPFCPEAAKVATVKVKLPIIANPLEGFVYVASQNANPFGSLVALYIVARDPVSGVLAKIPGEVALNPTTGQIVSTFDNIPQAPVEDLELHFFGGARGPLATPTKCGTYTTSASFTPWSGGAPVHTSSAFQITSGPNGTPCPNPQPFAPSVSAGTVNNQAGAFSPFTVTFSRQDQDQDIAGVTVTTPPGLLGILKTVERCPEPQASQGTCGPNSLIGHTTVGAGAGADPFYVQGGQVFLTGPYKGAPFGLSIVVPAVAGPYNLGNVVVRAAIHVDPHTAQITVVSDPLPTILQGIPLNIRDVNVSIDRPGFMFNPTSCQPLSVGGSLTSTQGATANVSSRFQAANCATLPFKPSFKVSTQAKTSKKSGASLDVKVGYPQGTQANIRSVAVTLPKQLPSRLSTIQQACPDATFNANPASCPAGSVIGTATATTPVLAGPVSGPAYLVSHGGAAFPDLVLILQGEGITLELIGSINIKKLVTSSAFESVPDAPISSFELKLPEGPHSGLTAVLPAKAKGNLCGTALTMPTTLTGQNGAVLKQSTKITVTGCPKAKKESDQEEGKAPRHEERQGQGEAGQVSSGTVRKPRRAPPEVPARSRVSEIQRQRLLAGMAEVAADRGVGSVTVAHIVARSGVSRRTFYELFSDREDCLLAALDQAIARASTVVLAAYESEARWRERMRAALGALLQLFDEEPAMAGLCVVESLGAGPRALERRTGIVRILIGAVDEGRGEAKSAEDAPPLTAEGVVGAVLAVIHARLVEPNRKPLSPLTPALMSMIVHPYLGQAAAEKELNRPAPQLKTKTRPRRDPLDGLDMRLTYRTVRVLIAIGSNPQASNRGVATAAGIADQGQISKLLARLENLGLIHNQGAGQAKGAPNAWALTPTGAEVERSMRS